MVNRTEFFFSFHCLNEPRFRVLCGIDGCSRTYKNYYSLTNQLIRKHGVTRDKPDKANESQDEEDELMFDIDAAEDEDYQYTEITRKQIALRLLQFK